MTETLKPTAVGSLLDYQVQGVFLDWARAWVRIWLRNPAGKAEAYGYSGAVATTLMRQLNKANLSTISLHRRILERLVADGKLPAGTVAGVPD